MKRWPGNYLLFTMAVLAVLGAPAQSQQRFAVQNYTVQHGLIGNEAVKTITGRKGFLWTATHSGISRFDGRTFKNYTYVPGDSNTLRSIWVTDLTLDKDSVLWASTEWGVCYFNEQWDRFIYIAPKSQFTILYKAPLYTDTRGTIWLAAENGLFTINPVTKQYQPTIITRIKDPQGITENSNGDIVVATRGNGLYIFNPVKNTVQQTTAGLPAATHFMQPVLWQGSVWIASNAGLVQLQANNSSTVYTRAVPGCPPGAMQQLMTVLPVQLNGQAFFLCGTYNKGLVLFNLQQQVFEQGLTNEGTLLFNSNSTVHHLAHAGGHIWLSAQTGLYKIAAAPANFVEHRVTEKNNRGTPLVLQHIIADKSRPNLYWIFSSQDNGTLVLYNQQSGQVVKKMHAKTAFRETDDNLTALLQDSAGNVYTFANRYINIFSPAGNWLKEIDVGRILNTACFDTDGNIWAGTADGIAWCQTNTGIVKVYDNTFRGTDVEQSSFWQSFGTSAIDCTNDGTVWLSSFKYGLFSFDKSSQKFTAHRQPFTGAYETLNRCSSLKVSGDTVWTGTMAGLTAYLPAANRFVNYNSANGLKSAYVYSVDTDKNGIIWGRGNNGIFYLDQSANKFVNYSLPDSYNVLYFTQSIHCEQDGCLLTLPGMYASFRTRLPQAESSIPLLSGLTAEGIKVITHNTAKETEAVTLPYTDNDIRIDFTAVDFSDQPVYYQYRLKGLDDKWIDNGQVNYANYSNLPSGNFVFEVKSKRGEEDWGSAVPLLHIKITAAFWRTAWFMLLVALLLITAAVILYRWRVKKIEQRQQAVNKLQHLQLERYKQQLELEQIVNYFSSSLSNKNTQEEVIWDVAKNLIQKLGFANCMIYLWNEDKTELLQKAGYGPNGSLETVEKEPFNAVLWQGIVGHVAATKKPIMLGDTSKDARYRADVLTRFSELCVPALYNGELISVIDSEDYAKDYYTPQHLQILTTIATLMAAKLVAIEAAEDVQRKKEEINRMNEQVAQLELASLRSQMNPHFIFNSLNSVQKYIWESREEDAAEYLAKFAKLMRAILENSSKNVIPLYEEVEVLKIYTELEHRRSNGRFEYEIIVAEDIDLQKTAIPPMLLQPFIENAVWHGLSKKQGKGHLSISVKKQQQQLLCVVDDNGVGRNAGGVPATEKKSLGIGITRQRIQRIAETTRQYASVEIKDKMTGAIAEGTTVIITLPLQLI